MRLIDGHALMESLKKATSNAIKPDFTKGLLEARRLTINAPTIDAVEVVRCKDCIFYEKALSVQGFCHNHESIVYVNDFCSYGERREDGEE